MSAIVITNLGQVMAGMSAWEKKVEKAGETGLVELKWGKEAESSNQP